MRDTSADGSRPTINPDKVNEIRITYIAGGESVTMSYQPKAKSIGHEGDRLLDVLREVVRRAIRETNSEGRR